MLYMLATSSAIHILPDLFIIFALDSEKTKKYTLVKQVYILLEHNFKTK